MNGLTHFDEQGRAHMVDVAGKAATHRIAVANGRIEMLPGTLALIQNGTAKKGDKKGEEKKKASLTVQPIHLVAWSPALPALRVGLSRFERSTIWHRSGRFSG